MVPAGIVHNIMYISDDVMEVNAKECKGIALF